jgi:predicted PilT family ATPase
MRTGFSDEELSYLEKILETLQTCSFYQYNINNKIEREAIEILEKKGLAEIHKMGQLGNCRICVINDKRALEDEIKEAKKSILFD